MYCSSKKYISEVGSDDLVRLRVHCLYAACSAHQAVLTMSVRHSELNVLLLPSLS